ncbi:phosphodiester glycosidase family protein [Arsenicibacter rosenii]|uniref:Phosphodiester glycosidase domain-containing protein n=1 Tax=Arsenicibacter rosenii TaxID=1750698 RepID=A0A1S2VMI7_9BACT|nr:phosphodiester glycosidase family protein [Arsenicibacter rosenii]OIN59981.1 hypothetical protein BLX24_07125 [Arsenicibacter rosenii]
MRFICFLLCLAVCPAFAQPPSDSLRFARQTWKQTKVKRRIVWREAHVDTLFQAPQNINILMFPNGRRKPSIRFGSAGQQLKPTSWFGNRDRALAAVNGTFFDVKNGGSVDMITVGGQLMDTTRYTPGKALPEHQQAAILIEKNKVKIVLGGNQAGWERSLTAPDVMVTGPLLILDGNRHPLLKNAFNDNRHPRTCACVTTDNKVLLLTADGRNAKAAGLNLHELASVMKWLGCRDAINLDGGGSTTMWVQGQPENGVVNYPSDSKQWIHTGERPVSNVLYVK